MARLTDLPKSPSSQLKCRKTLNNNVNMSGNASQEGPFNNKKRDKMLVTLFTTQQSSEKILLFKWEVILLIYIVTDSEHSHF